MPVTVVATRSGALDACDQEKLAALGLRLSEGEPRVLLHLHGGLVDEDFARAMAARLSGHSEASYGAPPEWEQVYVVWRTGALETLKANWRSLAENDRLYRTLLRRLLWAVSEHVGPGAAGGRGAAVDDPLPPGLIDAQLRPGVDRPFEQFDEARASAGAGPGGGVDPAADEALALTLGQDGELDDAARRVEAAIARERRGGARGGVVGAANPEDLRSWRSLDRAFRRTSRSP